MCWNKSSTTIGCHRRLAFVAVMAVLMITENGMRAAVNAQCPFGFWDKPSKRCAQPLITALQATVDPATTETASLEPRNNRTCANWERTNACYQQLIRDCSGDDSAVAVLRAHLRRYLVYSRPCNDRSQRNQQLSDCFMVHFTPTQTCTEAFDKYFRSFVVDKQYSNACRVVSSALKCFHDLTQKIESGHCGTDGAAEYRRSYIQPVVDQSRDTVTSKCTLAPPYDRDYASSTAASFVERRPRTPATATGILDASSPFAVPTLCVAVAVAAVGRLTGVGRTWLH